MKIIAEEAMTLWNNGLLDTEIAEHFNCSKATIQQWRQRNYLKSNSVIARNKKSSISHAQLIKLWENGLKDSEIAKELNCATITVWKFREENGMGSNVGVFDWGGGKDEWKSKKSIVIIPAPAKWD